MRIQDVELYANLKASITLTNLKKIIDSKQISIVKLAMSAKISDSTVKAYMCGRKIPSVPTLISLGDYLNCNLDYLLDRCSNPARVDDLDVISNDTELKQLMHNIMSLPKDKQALVNA